MLQNINGGFYIPNPANWGGSGVYGPIAGTALTASGHKAGWIFQVPKTGYIRKIHVRYQTVTVDPTTRMQAHLETVVSSTGLPSGTNYGGCADGTSSIAPANTTWDVITMGADAAATKGDLVAVVVSYQTFVSDSVQFTVGASTAAAPNLPYSLTNTGTWSKTGNAWVCAIEYSDGSFGYIDSTPFVSVTAQTFNSTTNPNEYALAFQMPFAGRVGGMLWSGTWGNVNSDMNYCVYGNNGTTPDVVCTINRTIQKTGNADNYIVFPTGYVFAPNEIVRISIQPVAGTTNATLQLVSCYSAAVLDQLSGGQAMYLSKRNGGAWTDTFTDRPYIAALIDQLCDDANYALIKRFNLGN